MNPKHTIASYLLAQLRRHGIEHIFGVAGDFVLSFMREIEQSGISLINTCDEQGAGFAADAYARLKGLGAVCVTYGVGGLKLTNTTAQAFAERSPVVILSGAPGIEERQTHPLLHHRARDFDSQRKIFEELTVASAILHDPSTAADEIDRVLSAALRQKRPVYFELPRDTISLKIRPGHPSTRLPEKSDPEVLAAALDDVASKLRAAARPVIVLGEEVHRFNLQDEVLSFLHRTRIPAAGTILGKSVIDEEEPFYLGIYQGAIGRSEVRSYVENSDVVLLLGVMMTDVNLGIYTARLDRAHCIHAVAERISVGYRTYDTVQFDDFIHGLAALELPPFSTNAPFASESISPYRVNLNAPITATRLFERLNTFLTREMIVLADPGDALFGAADLRLHTGSGFLAPAYYASLGFAVPGSVGAHFARPDLRPLVLVGDGSFQMTGMELSTAARYGLNPIVVLLNNRGYTTERFIQDGPFNDIHNWRYCEIPQLLGYGRGMAVRTEGDLEHALETAAGLSELSLLEIHLEPSDATPGLRRLASGLQESNITR